MKLGLSQVINYKQGVLISEVSFKRSSTCLFRLLLKLKQLLLATTMTICC